MENAIQEQVGVGVTEIMVLITSRATEDEVMLVEKFDPLATDKVEKIAGFIVRSAVDIERYGRSVSQHPDRSAHYAKLSRAVMFQANARFNEFAQTSPEAIESAVNILDSLEWPMVKPVIQTNKVLYSGTEPEYSVLFPTTPITGRSEMPA